MTASKIKVWLVMSRHPTADAMFGLGNNSLYGNKKPGLKMIWCMLVTHNVPSGFRPRRAFQKHPEAEFVVGGSDPIRSMASRRITNKTSGSFWEAPG